jgi:hypothetical protein
MNGTLASSSRILEASELDGEDVWYAHVLLKSAFDACVLNLSETTTKIFQEEQQ